MFVLFRKVLYRLQMSSLWQTITFYLGRNRKSGIGASNRLNYSGAHLRRVRFKIIGVNNSITIEQNSRLEKNVVFEIIGDNNEITIGQGNHLIDNRFYMRGSNHRIAVGHHCDLTGAEFWLEDTGCRVSIGDHTSIAGRTQLAATEERSEISIGGHCMFAYDIDIRTGDSHSIVDMATDQRLNPCQNVTIEDHVWIAARSVILKGVTIGSNSIVGTGAIVTKSVPSHALAVGNPATVKKTGVTWLPQRL